MSATYTIRPNPDLLANVFDSMPAFSQERQSVLVAKLRAKQSDSADANVWVCWVLKRVCIRTCCEHRTHGVFYFRLFFIHFVCVCNYDRLMRIRNSKPWRMWRPPRKVEQRYFNIRFCCIGACMCTIWDTIQNCLRCFNTVTLALKYDVNQTWPYVRSIVSRYSWCFCCCARRWLQPTL